MANAIPRKRWISLIDIIFFIGFWLLGIGAVIGALLTPQEWDLAKKIAVGAIPIGFSIFVSVFFILKWRARPDFIAEIPETLPENGIAVWVNGLNIHKKLVENSALFFINEFSELAKIPKEEIISALKYSTCGFKKYRVSMIGRGFFVEDKEGLQKGKQIVVHWNGSIPKTALFHEWIHLVDEMYRRKKEGIKFVPDYQHKGPWWKLESNLITKWIST